MVHNINKQRDYLIYILNKLIKESSMPHLQLTISITNSNQINAVSGYAVGTHTPMILFSRGMMDNLSRADIAVIAAHEIGHLIFNVHHQKIFTLFKWVDNIRRKTIGLPSCLIIIGVMWSLSTTILYAIGEIKLLTAAYLMLSWLFIYLISLLPRLSYCLIERPTEKRADMASAILTTPADTISCLAKCDEYYPVLKSFTMSDHPTYSERIKYIEKHAIHN